MSIVQADGLIDLIKGEKLQPDNKQYSEKGNAMFKINTIAPVITSSDSTTGKLKYKFKQVDKDKWNVEWCFKDYDKEYATKDKTEKDEFKNIKISTVKGTPVALTSFNADKECDSFLLGGKVGDVLKLGEKSTIITISEHNVTFMIRPENKVCNYLSCESEIILENSNNFNIIINSSDLIAEVEGSENIDITFSYDYVENKIVNDYDCTGDILIDFNFSNCNLTGNHIELWNMTKTANVNEGVDIIIPAFESKTFTLHSIMSKPESQFKYNVSIFYLGIEYKIDPYFNTTNSTFNNGVYNQTFLNESGFIQLNLSYSLGDYVSEVFDSLSTSTWNNISWVQGRYYGNELPNNKEIEIGFGGANMSGNTLLMHMDGYYKDVNNNYTGITSNNVTSVTGKFGNASLFSNTYSAIIIDDYPTNFKNITVSFWYNINSVNSGKWVGLSLSNAVGFWIEELSYGAIQVRWRDETGGDGFKSTDTETNAWKHVAWKLETYNTTHWNASLFIDGSKVITKITPYGIGNVSSSPILLLGNWHTFSTTGAIEGKLDEVAIYDNAKSDNYIIHTLYRSGIGYIHNGTETDLVSAFHLDKNVSTMNDNSGSSNIGYTNDQKYSPRNAVGKFDSSLNFDGNDYITIADTPSLETTNGTISLWFNPSKIYNSSNTNIVYFISKGNSYISLGISDNRGYYAGISNGAIFFQQYNGTIHIINSSQNTWNKNTWYHIAGTWDDAGMKLYINGVKVDENIHTNDWTNTVDNWAIGASTINDYNFNGTMDEISILDRSLSTDEILNYYKRGIAILNISARSCNDSLCSGENWTDYNNNSPQNLSEIDNQYFQYKFYFNTSIYPQQLYNVSIGYTILIPIINNFQYSSILANNSQNTFTWNTNIKTNTSLRIWNTSLIYDDTNTNITSTTSHIIKTDNLGVGVYNFNATSCNDYACDSETGTFEIADVTLNYDLNWTDYMRGESIGSNYAYNELRVNFSIGNTAVAGYVVECYLKYPDMSIAKPKINLTDLGTGYYNYPNFYNFTTNDSKGVYTINCENLNNSYTYSTVVNLNATGTLSSFVVKNWLLVERCIHNQSNYCTQAINATHTGYNIRGEVVESGHASGYSLGEELSFDTNPLTCNNDVTYRNPSGLCRARKESSATFGDNTSVSVVEVDANSNIYSGAISNYYGDPVSTQLFNELNTLFPKYDDDYITGTLSNGSVYNVSYEKKYNYINFGEIIVLGANTLDELICNGTRATNIAELAANCDTTARITLSDYMNDWNHKESYSEYNWSNFLVREWNNSEVISILLDNQVNISVNSNLTSGHEYAIHAFGTYNLSQRFESGFGENYFTVINTTTQTVTYPTEREKENHNDINLCLDSIMLRNARNDTNMTFTYTMAGYNSNGGCLINVTEQIAGNYSFNITTTPNGEWSLNEIKIDSYNYTILPSSPNNPTIKQIGVGDYSDTGDYISGLFSVYIKIADDESDAATITSVKWIVPGITDYPIMNTTAWSLTNLVTTQDGVWYNFTINSNELGKGVYPGIRIWIELNGGNSNYSTYFLIDNTDVFDVPVEPTTSLISEFTIETPCDTTCNVSFKLSEPSSASVSITSLEWVLSVPSISTFGVMNTTLLFPGLATSPTGVTHSFLMNSEYELGRAIYPGVRMKITVTGNSNLLSNYFLVDNIPNVAQDVWTYNGRYINGEII